MKKIIVVLLLCSLNVAYGQVDFNEIVDGLKIETNGAKKRVAISISIGNASYRCRGLGICGEIIIEDELKPDISQLLVYGNQQKALVISKNTLTEEQIKTCFSTTDFIMEEDFQFSTNTVKKLFPKAKVLPIIELKKGNYKLIETKNFYIISF
jgi:hypothetical protein